MKLTNKYNLPEAYIRAVSSKNNKPDNSTFRITRLISPPRITQLLIRHWHEIEADVSDFLWAILGTAVHNVLEYSDKEKYLTEHRITCNINNCSVSGQVDLYDKQKKKIIDWKTASIWKYIMGDNAEWEKQFNCYAHLLRMNGYEVNEIEAVALFKDWHESGTVKKEYPPAPVIS